MVTKKAVKKTVKPARALVNAPASRAKKAPVKARALVNRKNKLVTKHGTLHIINNRLIGRHWHTKGNNGEVLAWCEPMYNRADVIANLELNAKILTAAARELRKGNN